MEDTLTVDELKVELRRLHLPLSGRKAELIARIRKHRLSEEFHRKDHDDDDGDDDRDGELLTALDACHESYREPDAKIQDEDAEFDLLDVQWMGVQYRDEAQLPFHLYLDPLCMQFLQYIEKNYNLKFTKPEQTVLDFIKIDSMNVLNNRRQPATQKAYMTFGCLFFIYICFFADVPPSSDSPFFTMKNCSDFLQHYVHMPKRKTYRGTSGLQVPSMGMINKCAMVLNGMYKRTREIFGTYLRDQHFDQQEPPVLKRSSAHYEKFFVENIADGKPASANNNDWREIYREHRRSIKLSCDNNHLPNNEVVKASVRLTDDELYAICLQQLGIGGLKNTRTAALLASNLVSVGRTGETTNALWKDTRHLSFQCGTSNLDDLYSPPTPAAGLGPTSTPPGRRCVTVCV